MNYDTMEAGPEMDLLIGTLVMGWKAGELYSDEDRKECPNLSQSHYYDADGSLGLYSVFDFRPSVKISHAWQVIDHLKRSMGYGFEILVNPGHTRVRINYGESAVVMARTVPMGICRCALAALKSTHKES